MLVPSRAEQHVLGHSFIGTEHLLLGLILEADAASARTLEAFGLTIQSAREAVVAEVGGGAEDRGEGLPRTLSPVVHLVPKDSLMGH